MKRIANYESGSYATRREPFQGSNLFANWVDRHTGNYTERQYVVWSYGHHWPLFLYHDPTDTWYENRGKYSQSTSRQQSQVRPSSHRPIVRVSADELKQMVSYGVDGRAIARLRHAHTSNV